MKILSNKNEQNKDRAERRQGAGVERELGHRPAPVSANEPGSERQPLPHQGRDLPEDEQAGVRLRLLELLRPEGEESLDH